MTIKELIEDIFEITKWLPIKQVELHTLRQRNAEALNTVDGFRYEAFDIDTAQNIYDDSLLIKDLEREIKELDEKLDTTQNQLKIIFEQFKGKRLFIDVKGKHYIVTVGKELLEFLDLPINKYGFIIREA
jgi:hypothetical protein